MIYDHRTYTCNYGTIRKQIALYEELGLAVQQRHLGKPVLYALTEVGDVNAFIHVWAYESLADRTEKRAALQADPDWQAYLKASGERGYLKAQENTILFDAPFMAKG